MELEDIRREIDRIDRELIALLDERLDLAAAVANTKCERGLPIFDAERERHKLAWVARSVSPQRSEAMCSLFEEIMAANKNEQRRVLDARAQTPLATTAPTPTDDETGPADATTRNTSMSRR